MNDHSTPRPLQSVRRLTLLADRVAVPEAGHTALAGELLTAIGCQEVHLHHIAGESENDLVVIHLLDGDGRVTYLSPRAQRPAGVSWVASARRPLLVATEEDLASSIPRLAATQAAEGALLLPLVVSGDADAVVVLARRRGAPAFTEPELELATTLVE